ncbi:MAG TPA: VOC family protein [Thermoleophilaceae bacterium]|jgi:predicted enzyme related to lactoylglutathione lyase|nr:VOC family protein [Thermoleophilaceae bacterium]
MIERDGYIAGVPCWIDTTQPDPEAATAFYGGLFGWEFEDVMPPDSTMRYFVARLRGGDVAAVGSQPEGAPPMALWNTYIWVDSADETAEKVKAAGGQVISEPFDVMNAGRMAVLSDSEGAVFCVWEAREHKGAQVVNEHGSLNFNNLNTRDVEGAKAFYGAVFGWKTLALGDGMAWQLPGYGDFLERTTNPGIRRQMADAGAPAGFEDVAAGINRITDDQPPNWGVTFAVDDADAVADKAYDLGGKVVVPPFDAPWVRMTILQDPAGATFVASKFVPENKDLASQGAEASRAA